MNEILDIILCVSIGSITISAFVAAKSLININETLEEILEELTE